MKNFIFGILVLGTMCMGGTAYSAEHAKVFFIEPKNGAEVSQDFTVKFGVEGMKVKPAGTMDHNTGHHHLVIDEGSVPEGQVVGKDATHLHFGKGETETKLHLAPGEHTLTLQFANGAHISYGKKMAAAIKVKVK